MILAIDIGNTNIVIAAVPMDRSFSATRLHKPHRNSVEYAALSKWRLI